MGGISLRKQTKRLKKRRDAFDEHGTQPTRNPGKETPPMEMHRPGSNTK